MPKGYDKYDRRTEKAPETSVQPDDKSDYRQSADKEEAIWDMKQELEDYIEDQGIYIRQ